MPIRKLVVVLGDQLDHRSAAFERFDPSCDCVWMAEACEEAEHVVSAKMRTVMFLAAMRHFRDELRAKDWRVEYFELCRTGGRDSLKALLEVFIAENTPAEIIAVEPGEWRLREALRETLWPNGSGDWLQDRHFLCTRREFEVHASGRKQLRMEFFYREMRRRYSILMDGDLPVGGAWNFDAENRGSFGKAGPGQLPAPATFAPDDITKGVMSLVEKVFPDAPGTVEQFSFPVSRDQALLALGDFIRNRLPYFGRYQDAMWTGQPWLYHARLSAALNLKLLSPLEVVLSAQEAWQNGKAPIEAVEGFIRQILGWREYVRGIYWLKMPSYAEGNFFSVKVGLPSFYWSGRTEMACLKDAIEQTLHLGYAHHIQRLMVTGLYALLLGVNPKEVHEWYLGMYVDAVEWVEMPNTIGMSQFADGGVMASKPYVATGKYIQRMSNYCVGCRFDPSRSTGEGACPFTTLYWDFLDRNRKKLEGNQRMALQLKNLDRLDEAMLVEVRKRAEMLRDMA